MTRRAVGDESDAFAQALRRAIEARDLPLGRIQRHVQRRGLSIGRSTLSYWQNGLRSPSGLRSFQAVEVLEEVLNVPSGTLTSLLVDPRAPGPAPDEDFDAFKAVLQRLDAVGLLAKFRMRTGFARLHVSESGAVTSIEIDIVARARSEADRYVVIVGTEVGGDGSLLTPSLLTGGRIVRTAIEAEQLGIEILLETPVRQGDFIHLRYRVGDANNTPSRSFLKFSPRAGSLSGLEIDFSPERPPVAVEQFERASLGGPDLAVKELRMGSGHRISVIREVPRRGLYGVRWTYADTPDTDRIIL
ncbi:MAG: hypothetical protein V9G15_06495 [Dermatophilaceae bacterium]|nr:hypothetical protein [Actinomycetales bacterium]